MELIKLPKIKDGIWNGNFFKSCTGFFPVNPKCANCGHPLTNDEWDRQLTINNQKPLCRNCFNLLV
jgi:hypothetical protein